jgi:hypothetical protein
MTIQPSNKLEGRTISESCLVGSPGRNSMTLRTILVAVFVASVLSGCRQGYPSEDGAASLGRSPASLVATLNALSIEAGSPERWRYQQADRCSLEVAWTEPSGRISTVVLRMSGYWVHLRAIPDNGGFAIMLDPLAAPEAPEVRVFTAGKSRHASAASSLVQQMIAVCKEIGT